jgi:hypothetical protein
MGSFPNTFSPDLQLLPADLGERGNDARDRLAEKGFIVVAGLTRKTAAAVIQIAKQPHVVKYCPKDRVTRFPDIDATKRHLGKGGGRAMFLLARVAGGGIELDTAMPTEGQVDVEGYGWVGDEPCVQLPNNPRTFAVRVGENARGYGAGEPFTTAIITGSAALYGATGFGLETWQSNSKAVDAYEKAGWQFATSQPDERSLPDGGSVPDIRRYYAYPDAFLPQPQQAKTI